MTKHTILHSKKYFIIALLFIAGLLIGHYLSIYTNVLTGITDYAPSAKQSDFVRACSELNNQEISLKNVSKVPGWCFVKGGLNNCDEENISRLKSGVDPFFNIYQQKHIDPTWICAIGKTADNKIKAWTYYQYN